MGDAEAIRGESPPLTLDPSRLDSLREVDPGLAAEVAAMWLKTTPTVLHRVRAAVAAGATAELASAAHALRGSSANVGADALAQACADLERAGRAGSSPTAAMAAVTREHQAAALALAEIVTAG